MSDDVQSVSMRNEIGGCFQVAKLSNITSEAMGFLLPRVLNVPRFATKDIFRFSPLTICHFRFFNMFFRPLPFFRWFLLEQFPSCELLLSGWSSIQIACLLVTTIIVSD